MAIMKSKKKKQKKSREESPENFVRDDVPILSIKGDRNQRSSKQTKTRNRDDFREFYY
jgi:hypothetical protein